MITFEQLAVTQIDETEAQVSVSGHKYMVSHKSTISHNDVENDVSQEAEVITIQADSLVICAAYESHQLDGRILIAVKFVVNCLGSPRPLSNVLICLNYQSNMAVTAPHLWVKSVMLN